MRGFRRAAGGTEVVRIVDLDQARVFQVVGVDDAAIGFVVLRPQQGIDALDEGADVRGSGRQRIPEVGAGDTPTATRYQPAAGSMRCQNAVSWSQAITDQRRPV
jgi:hypothetical protein